MDVKVSVLEVDHDQGFVNHDTLKELLEDECRGHQEAGYAIVSVVPITSCIWGGYGHQTSYGGGGGSDVAYSHTSALMVVSHKRSSQPTST